MKQMKCKNGEHRDPKMNTLWEFMHQITKLQTLTTKIISYKTSQMRALRHSAIPVFQNEKNQDETVIKNENPEEDYPSEIFMPSYVKTAGGFYKLQAGTKS